MKKSTLLRFLKKSALCFAICYPQQSCPLQLQNQLLKIADQAGLFNRAIVDILKVREKIKKFISGKLDWKGADCNLDVVDGSGNKLPSTLRIIMKRPETLFGASCVVITTNHPDISTFTTSSNSASMHELIDEARTHHMLHRYQNPTTSGVATGFFACNPITKELMPIFVADYVLESYDTRITHAHVAVPAHDQKDFNFAKAHGLPIKLVVTSPEQGKSSSPQYQKGTRTLISAYAGEYDDCLIVESDFLNGSIHDAHDKALAYLQENTSASEYKKPYLYQLGHKQYSLHELQFIEAALQKDGKEPSAGQKEIMTITMIQAQADFLTIVEQFLINARDAKDLMREIIGESCTLHGSTDGYLFKWVNMNTTESEKNVFKRDINTFSGLCKFSSELVDFLGDFASSLPNALETIKNLKKT